MSSFIFYLKGTEEPSYRKLIFNKIGEGYMRCGSKCFLVTIEENGEKQIKPVTARSPVDARKTIRLEYGAETQILSVIKEDKKR